MWRRRRSLLINCLGEFDDVDRHFPAGHRSQNEKLDEEHQSYNIIYDTGRKIDLTCD